MTHYLSIILFTPLAGALLLLFVSKQNDIRDPADGVLVLLARSAQPFVGTAG